MLTKEQNERLTQVGPGTPGGELLRRYWQPFACAADLFEKHTMRVRVLGEDLALFRDASGGLGLVAENCPHRRCSLAYGVPENNGIRCPYHGWLFDNEGNCLEQPAEPTASTFKDRIKTIAYPVREMGGIFWTYMGPGEAPILLEFDYFVQPNTIRGIGKTMLPINWVQAMENSLDPTHLEWLHNWYGYYLKHGTGHTDDGGWPQARHSKIGFDENEYGITKRRVYEGGSEEDHAWKVGHPVIFPNILKQASTFQIRCIVDDTHTLHLLYSTDKFVGIDVPEQNPVPAYEFPYLEPDGSFSLNTILQQDMMAWVTQGAIADRSLEHLGGADRGISIFRKLFEEQIRKVEAGKDPIAVYRDDAHRGQIDLPVELSARLAQGLERDPRRPNTSEYAFSPITDEVMRLRGEEAKKKSELAS